jgi:hypothetical protein
LNVRPKAVVQFQPFENALDSHIKPDDADIAQQPLPFAMPNRQLGDEARVDRRRKEKECPLAHSMNVALQPRRLTECKSIGLVQASIRSGEPDSGTIERQYVVRT